jgi:ectoine hydroxylase-related dioxygenase (phytanoyl-CoA dioxygenase family)
MSATATVNITKAQIEQYFKEGYMILERVIPEEHLQMLREECQFFIDLENEKMDKAGTKSNGINHRGNRYFISLQWEKSKRLHEFIFSDLMAEICRATIGNDAYLFWEQYVVKAAEVGMKFAWHQDSGYVGFPHKRYVTNWCALDDMSVENGTAYILPFSRAGTQEIQPHVRDDSGSNDLVGYHGKDPGEPVIVPAGSIAVFSSVTFHRSGANTTNKMRRVYLPQFAPEQIINPKDGKPSGLCVPFLKDGKNVFKRS